MKLTCLNCGQINRVPETKLQAAPKCGACKAELVSGAPTEVSFDILAKAARTDGLPLVVDLWAGWCGPCKAMAPEFAKASATQKGKVRFAKLDTEAYPQANQQYGVRGIPLMIAFHNGREIKRQAGAMPAAQINDWASGLAHG